MPEAPVEGPHRAHSSARTGAQPEAIRSTLGRGLFAGGLHGKHPMCYAVILSTTSPAALSEHDSAYVRYSRDIPALAETAALRYDNRWYLVSRAGCSCTFRHASSPELGFAVPEDWYPEQADEIEATRQIAVVIRELLAAGHAVDCIDVWRTDQASPTDLAVLTVDLSRLDDAAFRFFENHHFDFRQPR